ncbi:MAG: quinone-dependent dihydroorotate dehydrogenase [Verrucomicrobiae bacterium]|nr:quinone-dependent dihydroorotate dehydrogenase [Verrucomicrobiae bacterium]
MRARPANVSDVTGLYEYCVRPVLFEQESEQIHERTLQILGKACKSPLLLDAMRSLLGEEALPTRLFGLDFPNPLGLAAGMDKHARAVPAWEAMGFGFCELGGVTWHDQPGNPQPRMFRAVADQALVNRMGFNNPGAATLSRRLAEWRVNGHWPKHPVGMNLGKSKITPLESAAEDYANSFKALRNYADFFVVNVSSPNTPNLRKLQGKEELDRILNRLYEANQGDTPRPILVKVAPDLTFEALDDIVSLHDSRKVAGFVATNTTIERPASDDPQCRDAYAETGGLSGSPLARRSTEVIRHLYRQTKGRAPIIGVGGIFNSDDAWEKILAGASLVQIYSSLVYRGPGVIQEIVSGLREKMAAHGLRRIQDAVGGEK